MKCKRDSSGIESERIQYWQCFVFCLRRYMKRSVIRSFLFPVVLGIVPDIIREKAHRKVSESAFTLQQCGIYTLVIGSIFRGVLDIYGTTNQAGVLYWTVGWGLVIVGGIAECIIKG